MCFWRVSNQSIATHRCSLISADIGVGIQSVALDVLHTMHLGVLAHYCLGANLRMELPCQDQGENLEDLHTAITCSGVAVSSFFKKSTSWSPICGTGTSKIGTKGETSTIRSKVCRSTHSYDRTSTRGVGRLGGGVVWPIQLVLLPPGPGNHLTS